MTTIQLKDITIQEKQDYQNRTYYLIRDNETDTAYFCFSGAVKTGWNELVNNWTNLKEIELEFEVNERGNNKVISLDIPQEGEFIIN